MRTLRTSIGRSAGLCVLVGSAGLVACGRSSSDTQPAAEEPSEPTSAEVPHEGLFHERRSSESSPDGELDELRALGYTTGSQPAPSQSGVTVNDDRAYGGYNLYTSGHGPEAYLLDMEGRELHRWRCEIETAWPELAGKSVSAVNRFFRRVHLFPSGDLLAIFDYVGLVKLDRDSKVLWRFGGGAHHDLDVAPNGDVLVLGHEERLVPDLKETPIQDNCIVTLDAEGREKSRLWISDAFLDSKFENYPELVAAFPGSNVFHTNTLAILDGTHEQWNPVFARGNLLVSVRNLGTIGIIDPQQGAFVWVASGPWVMQHEPVHLANGNMILFDNRPNPEEEGEHASRILEFDPIEQAMYWEYTGTDLLPFYSSVCGSVQRLPNDNTLITESDFGRAFEVTYYEKEIVWEFHNPHVAGDDGELVAIVPELQRLPPDFPVDAFIGD